MVPFNFQLELADRLTTFSAEQLDQLADAAGFMRYQVRTFNHRAVVCVNIEDEPLAPEEMIGYSEDEVFTPDQVRAIGEAIRAYNAGRKLIFDQLSFDF